MAAVMAMCQSVAHFFIAGATIRAPTALTARLTPVNMPISLTVQQRGRFISNRVDTEKSKVGNMEMKNAAIRTFNWTRCGPGDRNKENT